MMRQKSIVLIALVALPIFIRFLPIGASNFKTFIYGAFLIMIFLVITSKINFPKFSDPLLQFNFLFSGIILLSFLIAGNYANSMPMLQQLIMPHLISIAIIYYTATIKHYIIPKVLDIVFYGLIVIFLLQFALSIYEMQSGNPFFLYGFLKTHSLEQNAVFYQNRSFLNMLGFNLNAQFSLTMLIGHWNHSAPLLAIYNLVFLYLFYKKRNKYILVLPILVFFAALLNTTRAVIITLLITDLFFYFYIIGGSKRNVLIVKQFVFIVGLLLMYEILTSLYEFYLMTDTFFSGRLEYYSVYIEYIKLNFFQTIIGFGLYEASMLGEKLRTMAGYSGGSFESYFFSIIFTNGLIGFYIFLRLIFKLFTNSLNYKNKTNIKMMKLLALNIVLTSLTLGGITSIFTFPMLTVLYLNVKYTEKYISLKR